MDAVASKLARKSATSNRQVRLSLRYISVWSAAKVSFLCGVGLGLVGSVGVILLWVALSQLGVFGQLNTLFSGTSGSSGISIGIGQALGVAALIGPVDTIAATIAGTVAAALYNLGVRVMGGATLGFATESTDA
jgi:hypothetical protein